MTKRMKVRVTALVVAISAPFAGILLDRWGRKPVLVAALILFGLAGTSGYFMDSIYGILVGRAFLGLAVAGVLSGFTTLLTDYFSGVKLNKFMGYQAASIGIAGVIFPLIGGFLTELGWQFPFLTHLLAFLFIPGILFAIDEPVLKTRTSSPDIQAKKKDFKFKVPCLLPQ